MTRMIRMAVLVSSCYHPRGVPKLIVKGHLKKLLVKGPLNKFLWKIRGPRPLWPSNKTNLCEIQTARFRTLLELQGSSFAPWKLWSWASFWQSLAGQVGKLRNLRSFKKVLRFRKLQTLRFSSQGHPQTFWDLSSCGVLEAEISQFWSKIYVFRGVYFLGGSKICSNLVGTSIKEKCPSSGTDNTMSLVFLCLQSLRLSTSGSLDSSLTVVTNSDFGGQ